MSQSGVISAEQSLASKSRHDRLFETDYLLGDLKERTVRGGAITLVAQGLRLVIQIGSIAVLARLLTPEHFGLIAMVAALTGFVSIFKDMGLGMATVQTDSVNHEKVSTLFWINVAISFFLMMFVALLAPAVAWFYGDPRLSGITLALAVCFLFSGLSIQHNALLRRQLRFSAQAISELVSQLAGVGSAIVAAMLGAGFWSLVVMQLVAVFVHMLAVSRATGWRPGRPQRGIGVRPMLTFGVKLCSANFLGLVTLNLDKLLLGMVGGPTVLGFYGRAWGLALQPIRQISFPISNAVVPALCRLQNRYVLYRNYYLSFVEIMLSISIPVGVFVYVAAESIVLVFLGKQWMPSVTILRLMSPAIVMQAFNVPASSIFLSMGRSDKQLHGAALMAVVFTIAYVVGVSWGGMGLALSGSLAAVICRPLIVAYALHGSPVRFRDFGAAIWRPLVASGLAGIGLWATSVQTWSIGVSVLRLLLEVVLFTLFYAVIWMVLPGGFRFVRTTAVGLLRSVLGRSMRQRRDSVAI